MTIAFRGSFRRRKKWRRNMFGAPENFRSHFGLGFFYSEMHQPALAIASYRKSLERKPDDLTSYWNLVLISDRARDMARVVKWSRLALPHYEKHLRLAPDDEYASVNYASLQLSAEELVRALEDLDPLRGMAEFQELIKQLEEKSANQGGANG